MEQGTKSIEESSELSLQPRARGQTSGAGIFGLLNYLASGSYRISPWWSQQRDTDLENFWRDSDKLSGALGQLIAKIATVPVRVMPRDTRLKRHQVEAEEYTIRLNGESEFGAGWPVFIGKWLQDWWACDNGAFMEIIGDGDPLGPIEGAATGVANMDSWRCVRTGDPEFPVRYLRPSGGWIKYHRTRVAFAADMPSAREDMFGVGTCAISRCVQAAQNLMDIAAYKQEKLGSRPKRGMIIGKGVRTDAILDSIEMAEEQMDNRALRIFAQLPVIGDLPTDAQVELLDLVTADGFDEETSTRLGMFTVALAFGVPIRWLWPAATTGATKADAMYQHIAGLGGGVGHVLQTLTLLLGGDPRGSRHETGKFLPPYLKIDFDFQDDEQDRARAEIQEKRAITRNANLETGVINERVAREQALDAGDLTPVQFAQLELDAGRLPGGEPVSSLFLTPREPFLMWLDLGVPSPLSISVNDPLDMLAEIDQAAVRVQDALVNSGNATRKENAEQALAALNQLKTLYAPLAQQAVQSSVLARLRGQPSPEQEAEKAFDYGVSVGGVIGGELARGEGGRFINAQELLAQTRAGMLARMRDAAGDVGTNSAASKKGQNREAIAEAMGIPVDMLDGLAGMKMGTTDQATMEALAAQGYAEVQPNGDITMTTAGRSMLAAANSGDVDKAKVARAKAQTPKASAKPKAGSSGSSSDKPSAEERKREKEEQERKEREENKQEVAEAITERLPQSEFNALDSFNNGEDLTPDEQGRLARLGMVEIDEDGNARLTTEGKRLVSAAEKGDVRAAKDALSNASSKVAKTQEKANNYLEKADEVEATAQDKITEVQEDIDTLKAQRDEAIAEMQQQSTELATQANSLNTAADTALATSTSLLEQANAMQAEIDLMTDADERQRAITRQQELRDEAQSQREEAESLREQSTSLREQSLEITGLIQETQTKVADRLAELEERMVDIQQTAEERANDYREEADRLIDSVGGGTTVTSGKQLPWWKRLFRRKPTVEERLKRYEEIADSEVNAALIKVIEDETTH